MNGRLVAELGYIVAAAVTRLFARVWIGDASVDGIVGDLAAIVGASREPDSVKRRLTLDLAGVAEAVSARISPMVEQELKDLDVGERSAIVDHVQVCLRDADVSDVRAIVAANANVTILFAKLKHAGDSSRASLGLSAAGASFLDLVLIEIAQEIVEIATAMPSYVSARDAALLGRSANLEEVARELLERLPNFGDPEAHQPADYVRYEQLFESA